MSEEQTYGLDMARYRMDSAGVVSPRQRGSLPVLGGTRPVSETSESGPRTGPARPMRTFDTGATRDDDSTKSDYEGYLSPRVIEDFGRYMTIHRHQADGGLRASDNWQKGIPMDQYMKSLLRHVFELWHCHRLGGCAPLSRRDTLAAIEFNVMGYHHEFLKAEDAAGAHQDSS